MRHLVRANGGAVGLVPTAMAAALLSACAGIPSPVVATAQPDKPDTGSWIFERRADPITGAAGATAYLRTRQTHRVTNAPRFHKGWAGAAEMQLLCFKGEPVIRIAFDEIKVGSNRSASFSYRFDDKTGREPSVRFLQDYRTIVIHDKDEVAAFIGEMAEAKSLIIRVNSLVAGRAAAEFPVRGAKHAVAIAFADCPLEPAQQRTRTSATFHHRLNLLNSRTTFAASRGVSMRPSAQSST